MTSLRRQAATSAKWSALTAFSVTALQIGQLTVLGRLLSPEDFGLMAMVLLVVGFTQLYADVGISNAVIHRQQATKNELSSLYWLNVFAGGVLFFAFVAVVPLIVLLFKEPRLRPLLWWIAPTFLTIPWGQQFKVLLQRDLRFRELAWIQIGAVVAGTVAAIAAAATGFGALALVWGYAANVTTQALLLAAVGWRRWTPDFHFAKRDLRGYIGFGLYQAGERCADFFHGRVDQFLLGTMIGSRPLGQYSLAFNLAMQPLSRINPVLTQVAFPVFAKAQSDEERLRRGYLFVLRVVSMVNAPLLCGLAVVADELVPITFGPQWTPAVPLVRLLALVALLRSTGNPAGALLLAKGRADLSFRWMLATLVAHVPAVYFGVRFAGALGAAAAQAIEVAVLAVVFYPILIRPMIGRCLGGYTGAMAPSMAISLVMAAAVWGLGFVGSPSPERLVGRIITGALLQGVVSLLFQRKQWREVRDLLIKREP